MKWGYHEDQGTGFLTMPKDYMSAEIYLEFDFREEEYETTVNGMILITSMEEIFIVTTGRAALTLPSNWRLA